MPPLRIGLLIPLLVLMAGAIAMTACDLLGDPDLPDTTAASVLAYLDEVDYQESWSSGPDWARSTKAASRTGCY